MKKVLLVSTMALIPFFAQANPYIGGAIGYSHISSTDAEISVQGLGSVDATSPEEKGVFSGELSFGYDLKEGYGHPIRIELAYNNRGDVNSNKKYYAHGNGTSVLIDKGNINVGVDTLMMNYIYDIETSTAFKPYLEVGIGAAFIETGLDFTDYNKTDKNTDFAYSIGVGMQHPVADNLNLDVSARYLFAGKSEFKDQDMTLEIDHNTVDIMAGLNYTF